MRYVTFIAFLLSACVTVSSNAPFSLSYLTEDKPQDGKIYISYFNQTKHDICLDPIHWPNIQGELDNGKDRVFINVSGKRYAMADFNTGYCPGCQITAKTGSTLSGFFKYSDFGLPVEDYFKEKVLTFSPIATYCHSRHPR